MGSLSGQWSVCVLFNSMFAITSLVIVKFLGVSKVIFGVCTFFSNYYCNEFLTFYQRGFLKIEFFVSLNEREKEESPHSSKLFAIFNFFLYTVYDILSLAEVFLVIISLCTNLYFQFFPSRSADYSVISQTENRTKKPK